MKAKLLAVTLASLLCGCSTARHLQNTGNVSLAPSAATGASIDIARLHEKQGALEKATLSYQAIMEQEPQNPVPRHRLGVLAVRQGNLDQADRLFNETLQLRPADSELMTDIGYLRYLQNRMDEAEQSFRAALRKSPQNERALNNLGIVLAHIGKEREAFAAFSQATGRAEAHTSLGFMLAQNGEVEKAKFHLSKALDRNPDHRPAAQGLVEIARTYGVDAPDSLKNPELPFEDRSAPQPHNQVAIANRNPPVASGTDGQDQTTIPHSFTSTTPVDPFSLEPLQQDETYTSQLLARLSRAPNAQASSLLDPFGAPTTLVSRKNQASVARSSVPDKKMIETAAGGSGLHNTLTSQNASRPPSEMVSNSKGTAATLGAEQASYTALSNAASPPPAERSPATMLVQLGEEPARIPITTREFPVSTPDTGSPATGISGQVQHANAISDPAARAVAEDSTDPEAPEPEQLFPNEAKVTAIPAPSDHPHLKSLAKNQDRSAKPSLQASAEVTEQLAVVLEYGRPAEQMQAMRDILMLQLNSSQTNAQLRRLASDAPEEVKRAARIVFAELTGNHESQSGPY